MNAHLSFRYRRRRTPQQQREFCEAQRKRVLARHSRVLESRQAEPIRRTRVVEFPIRDTHRPFAMIRLEAEETPRGFTRWAVYQGEQRIGKRRLGRHAVAKLIAQYLQ